MQGPQGRNKGAKGAEASLQYLVCVCVPGYKSRTIRNSPVPRKKKTKNPMGEIQRQDPDLQQKLSTDRFRPDAVVLCPRCLQWIFVYSQISARPLAPRQAVIWALLPSHSVSQVFIIRVPDHSFPHVLLLNQKKPKKNQKTFPPNFGALPLSHPRLVHRKHSDVRITSLRWWKELLHCVLWDLCVLNSLLQGPLHI